MRHSFCVCDTSPRTAFPAELKNPFFEKTFTEKKHYE